MKKETAVEWLTDQLGIDGGTMRDNALAIERVELIRIDKLETLAKLLAKSWFYGNWEWETPNERIMQMLMQDLGYYPFKDEDEMIHHTRVDEDLYKYAVDKVALINPRMMPVENHTVDTNEMIDHIGEPNKMVDQVPDVGKMVSDTYTGDYPFVDDISFGDLRNVDVDSFYKGYNKAKETLFTKEEVQKMIDDAHYEGQYLHAKSVTKQMMRDNSESYYNAIIQSLKQPKQ